MSKDQAKRFNAGKPRLSLIPSKAQIAEAKVWEGGIEKYGIHNWKKGLPFMEVIDSLLRHVNDFKEGETLDLESGINHMAHVRCNAAMLIEYCENRLEFDDRDESDLKDSQREKCSLRS